MPLIYMIYEVMSLVWCDVTMGWSPGNHDTYFMMMWMVRHAILEEIKCHPFIKQFQHPSSQQEMQVGFFYRTNGEPTQPMSINQQQPMTKARSAPHDVFARDRIEETQQPMRSNYGMLVPEFVSPLFFLFVLA